MDSRRGMWLLAGCAVLLALAGGCSREYKLVFHNNTLEPVEVEYWAGPVGRQYVGRIAPGGVRRDEIEIEKDELPAPAWWSVNGARVDFQITERTRSPIHFYVDRVFGPGPAIDRNTQLRQHRSVEHAPVLESQQELITP